MPNKLHDSLGNWEKEGTELKSRIYEKTVNDPKKRKRAVWKPILTVAATAALLLGGAGIFAMMQRDVAQVAPTELDEHNEPAFRMHDELTLRIMEYVSYHRDPFFYSKEEVEFHSLMDVISIYALFNHLENHDYRWDEEKKKYYYDREMIGFENELKNPDSKAFYVQMFADLAITKEQYVEYYLLPIFEGNRMKEEAFEKHIGLEEDKYYPSGEAEKEYQALIGISEEELDEMALKIDQKQEVSDLETDLPFSEEAFQYGVDLSKNEEGELIFANIPQLRAELAEPYTEYIYNYTKKVIGTTLNRSTFAKYKSAYTNFESEDVEEYQLVKELAEILTIFERSIDWDAEF